MTVTLGVVLWVNVTPLPLQQAPLILYCSGAATLRHFSVLRSHPSLLPLAEGVEAVPEEVEEAALLVGARVTLRPNILSWRRRPSTPCDDAAPHVLLGRYQRAAI
jgi:hypothetical protein